MYNFEKNSEKLKYHISNPQGGEAETKLDVHFRTIPKSVVKSPVFSLLLS